MPYGATVGGTAFATLFALCTGFAGAVQITILGRFGVRIGSIEAWAFSTVVTAVIACVVVLIARRSLHGYVAGITSPAWMWLAGAMGAVIVLGLTFAGPRIGATSTIALLVGGQFALGILIDRFGWFGAPVASLQWQRLAGLGLLAGGAGLMLKYR